MGKYLKNKRMITLTAFVLATTLILTGTFAWSVILFSTTGGLGEDYYYIVKLLDEDSDPIFVIDNWKSGALDKKVYATSSYKDEDVAKQYNDIIDKNQDSIFRDTWVRIKLEETFMRNGLTSTDIVTKLSNDKLISSYNEYFSLDSNDVDVITLDTWVDNLENIQDYQIQGKFWILDEDTGWLYWAQPLLATTELNDTDPETEDQTTSHIIDKVTLINQPSGIWEYTIKATLEAMDVELQGYNDEGVWNDIDKDHPIYDLLVAPMAINEINFPDKKFRTWIGNNVVGAGDGFLTQAEINKITSLDIRNQGISDLTGINHFRKLVNLDVSGNYLRKLDVTGLTKLSEATFEYNPQYHNSAKVEMIFETDTMTKDIKKWKIDENRYDQDLNVLINQYNFPDETFRDYLIEQARPTSDNWDPTYIENEKISQANLAKVTQINVNGKNIESLEGLEHFPKLQALRVANIPNLVDLDVSKNEALGLLRVDGSLMLRSLDLSNNKALGTLWSYDTPSLTSIELGPKPSLTTLRVQNSQLSRLDITGCTNQTFRDNINNTSNFNYSPQKNADGLSNKTLKTPLPLTAETNLLEWE